MKEPCSKLKRGSPRIAIFIRGQQGTPPILFGPRFASPILFSILARGLLSLVHYHTKSVKMTGARHGGQEYRPSRRNNVGNGRRIWSGPCGVRQAAGLKQPPPAARERDRSSAAQAAWQEATETVDGR